LTVKLYTFHVVLDCKIIHILLIIENTTGMPHFKMQSMCSVELRYCELHKNTDCCTMLLWQT